MRLKNRGTGWSAAWGRAAGKSSGLEVTLRASGVLGRAEMFLICSSGATRDQYTDLSRTDCMMFGLAPSSPQEVHQPSSDVILCFSGQVRASFHHGPFAFILPRDTQCDMLLLYFPCLFTPNTHKLLVHAHKEETSKRMSPNK